MPVAPRLRHVLATSWVGLGATAGTVAAAALIGTTHGAAKVVWVAAAVAAALAQFAANRSAQAEHEAQVATADAILTRARTEAHVAVGAALVPLLRLVAQVHEEPDDDERHALRRTAVVAVLAAVAASLGPVGEIRACWFVLDISPAGELRGLRYDVASGRSDEPRLRFDASTPVGRDVMRMVLADGRAFVADLDRGRPPAWSPQDRPTGSYTSFLAVPVRTERQVHGMLSVDAAHPGSLDLERDEPLVLTFARVLAAALAQPVDREGGPV